MLLYSEDSYSLSMLSLCRGYAGRLRVVAVAAPARGHVSNLATLTGYMAPQEVLTASRGLRTRPSCSSRWGPCTSCTVEPKLQYCIPYFVEETVIEGTYAVVAEVTATNALAGSSGAAGTSLEGVDVLRTLRHVDRLTGGHGRDGGDEEGDDDGNLSELHVDSKRELAL